MHLRVDERPPEETQVSSRECLHLRYSADIITVVLSVLDSVGLKNHQIFFTITDKFMSELDAEKKANCQFIAHE